MTLASVLGFFYFLALTTTTSQEISIKKGCQTKCGNVTIPYPFGVGPGCSLNSSFAITCDNTTAPPTPFLASINRQVVSISVHGAVIVNQPVSPINCSSEMTRGFLNTSLEGSPFTISARYNTLAVLGCTNSVWLRSDETTTVGGCMAICQTNTSANTNRSSCDGLNCCKATIPEGLQRFQFSYRSIQSSSNGFCGYAFPVDKKWFRHDYRNYTGLLLNQSFPYDQEFISAPLVLEWEVNNPQLNNLGACRNADDYRSISNIDEYSDPSTTRLSFDYYREYEYVSSTSYCYCQYGYQGSPYVPQGCIDIDECLLNTTITYCNSGTCFNTIGSYKCLFPRGAGISKGKIASISIGSVLGALLLALAAFQAVRTIRKRIKNKRRQEFFKRNGGLLLQQQLSSTDNSLDKTKMMVKLREDSKLQQNEDCGKESEAIEVDDMYEDFSSITGSMRFDSSSITIDDHMRLLGS
ncbi:non-specific serine/threonine protein kinase [Salvia divinorum]|uniref:Non-specific serine/threonine protein kinase n=1 Tax=Salvia divinorum TaxID=28513 RepID=A0ABD1HB16_SALDI